MRTFKFKAVSVAISMALALALPFGVMAADGFGDGAAVDAEWDDSEAFDYNEDSDIVSEVGDDFGFFSADAFVGAEKTDVSPQNIRFYWKDATYADYTVIYDLATEEGTVEPEDKDILCPNKAYIDPDPESRLAPDCENAGRFRMLVKIPGWDNPARPADGLYVSQYFEDPADPAKGHQWGKAFIDAQKSQITCEKGGVVFLDWVCEAEGCGKKFSAYKVDDTHGMTDSGKVVALTDQEKAFTVKQYETAKGHAYKDVVKYLATDANGDPTGDLLAEVPDTAVYYKITARECQNVKNNVTTGCETPVEYVNIERIPNDATVKVNAYDNISAKGKAVVKSYENEKGEIPVPLPFDTSTLELIDCAKDGSLTLVYNHFEEKGEYKPETDYNKADDLKAAVNECIGKYNEMQTEQKITVPAHHTLAYEYSMADTSLIGTVDSYIVFGDGDGKAATKWKCYHDRDVDTIDDDLFAEGTVTILASRYCIPYDVKVEAYCMCLEHKPNQNTPFETKTVTASATPGKHLIDGATKDAIDGLTFDEKKDGVDLNEYEAFMKDRAKYVKEISNTATCTAEGEATVQYICPLCGGDAGTATIKITAFAHDNPKNSHNYESKVEDAHDSTCTERGYFNSVQVCSRCQDTKEIKKVYLPKIAHKWSSTPVVEWVGGVVVDPNAESYLTVPGTADAIFNGDTGEGKDIVIGLPKKPNEKISNYSVYPVVKIRCEVCGKEIEIPGTGEAEIKSVTKEGDYCQQGIISIVGKAKPKSGKVQVAAADNNGTAVEVKISTSNQDMSKDFIYYSSLAAYQGRTTHRAGAPVIENVVAPTEDKAGSHDEVVYCEVCHLEIQRRSLVDAALEHKHTFEKQDKKEATCTEPGNIEYWYCTAEGCGAIYKDEAKTEQITLEDTVIPALNHDLTFVEAKEATASEPGKKAHYECSRCGKMFSDEKGEDEVFEEELVVPYTGPELLPGPKTFNLKANKPNAGYMEFKLGEVEGAEKYRVSYRIAGTKEYTRQESDTNVVKITDLERGQVYDFTACAGDVLEDGQIQWGARALRKDGAVKYARRWYETVEQSKIAKKGTVITLEWTFLNDASKYEISIADNKAMDKAVTIDAAMFSPQIVGDKVQVSADISALPGFGSVPAGTQKKFYVRIRPYTMYDEKDVAGGVSNLRAKTIKF